MNKPFITLSRRQWCPYNAVSFPGLLCGYGHDLVHRASAHMQIHACDTQLVPGERSFYRLLHCAWRDFNSLCFQDKVNLMKLTWKRFCITLGLSSLHDPALVYFIQKKRIKRSIQCNNALSVYLALYLYLSFFLSFSPSSSCVMYFCSFYLHGKSEQTVKIHHCFPISLSLSLPLNFSSCVIPSLYSVLCDMFSFSMLALSTTTYKTCWECITPYQKTHQILPIMSLIIEPVTAENLSQDGSIANIPTDTSFQKQTIFPCWECITVHQWSKARYWQ